MTKSKRFNSHRSFTYSSNFSYNGITYIKHIVKLILNLDKISQYLAVINRRKFIQLISFKYKHSYLHRNMHSTKLICHKIWFIKWKSASQNLML